MFTQPCFIRKNTPELRKKLENLELKLINHRNRVLDYFNHNKSIKDGKILITYYNDYYRIAYEPNSLIIDGRMDCGDNEDLFLALVALRDDNDYMQYFICGNDFILCDREHWLDMYSVLHCGNKYSIEELDNAHKATVKELINYFKK